MLHTALSSPSFDSTSDGDVYATRTGQRARSPGGRRRRTVHGGDHARGGHVLEDHLEADGHIHTARQPGVEHRRVRGHRVHRALHVHVVPAPVQALPKAPEAHGLVLRHVQELHGRVRVLLRQLVARHLEHHGHGDGHPVADGRRVRGVRHMQLGLHEDPAQHHRSPDSNTHR